MGLSEPAWLKKMPANLRPDGFKVKELENARKRFNLSHDVFVGFVMQSPGITKMMFEQQFVEWKKRQPNATNHEILEYILQFRSLTDQIALGRTPEDARALLQQPQKQAAISSAMKRIRTIDALTRYVVDELQEFWQRTPDPFGINTTIAQILGYSCTEPRLRRSETSTQSFNALPSSPEGKGKLEFWMEQLNKHLNESFHSVETTQDLTYCLDPFQPDSEIQGSQLEKRIVELMRARDCAHQCEQVWPAGQEILERMIAGIELFSKAFRIQVQISELLMQPDSQSPGNQKRFEQLMAEGRKYAEQGDSLLTESMSHLERATGYQFVWDVDAEEKLPF